MTPGFLADIPRPATSRRQQVRAAAVLALLALPSCEPYGDLPPLPATASVQLAAGVTLAWRVDLDAGEMVRIRMLPGWQDVELRALDRDGHMIAHSQGLRGAGEREGFTLVAAEKGSFRIEVRSPEGAVRCRVKREGPRPATAADGRQVAAERQTQRLFDGLSLLYHEHNRIPEADQLAALAEIGQALSHWQVLGNRERTTSLSYQEAVILYDRGDFEQAADAFHRAERTARELGDPGLCIDAMNEAGRADRKRALKAADQTEADLRLAEADRHFREAADLCRAQGHREQLAVVLSNYAGLHGLRGEPFIAVQYLERARALARSPETALKTAINLCNVLQDLNERQRALEVCEETAQAAQHLQQEETTALNNLGTLYESLGEWTKALEVHRQALQSTKTSGRPDLTGGVLFNLGFIHQRLGDTARARAAYERALRLTGKYPNPSLAARSLARLARLAVQAGDGRSAVALARQAVARAEAKPVDEGIVRQALAAALLLTGDRSGARRELELALDLHRRRGELNSQATAELGLARVAQAEGDLQEALAHVDRGIVLIESLRVRVTSPDLRASFLASNQDFYAFKIDVLMALDSGEPGAGYAADALQTSERAHARSLLDVVAGAAASGLGEALLERERQVSKELNAGEWQRKQLADESALPAALSTQLQKAQDDYQRFQTDAGRAKPRYAALTQPEMLRLDQIQRDLLDRDTVLLEYALGEKQSYLWAVTVDRIEGFKLASRGRIETAVKNLYDRLTVRNDQPPGETTEQRRRRWAQADQELPRLAAELSELVLRPAAQLLPPGRRIVVVGDGALLYVPFAALPAPTGPEEAPALLLARHEIVALPSASVLAVLRREDRHRRTAPGVLAVLADPVFSADDERVRSAPRPAAQLTLASGSRGVEAVPRPLPPYFPRLPYASQEAADILALVPGGKVFRALGFDASRATALSERLRDFRIIHFGTHGHIDSEHPEKSSLVLTQVDRRGRPLESGYLQLSDIYGLELNADLVVLSACRTALGKEVRGEGLVGLTRGFMYAGAPRVVASLWSVDDRSTAELMKLFYRGMLVDHLRPAQALQQAQLALSAKRREPYFWAAFSLQGEWR